MPKALEPGMLFPIALRSDREKPAEVRATFYVPAVTIRDQEKYDELLEQWRQDVTNDVITSKEWFDRHVAFVLEHVRRWENMNDPQTGEVIPFNEDSVRTYLSREECREIAILFSCNGHLDDDEKKSLGSRRVSMPASSANTAEGNAKTKEPIVSQ